MIDTDRQGKFDGNIDKPANVIEFARLLRTNKTSDKTSRLQLGWFLEERARERKIPIRGCFELTPTCNLDCKMCYVHLNYNLFDTEQLLPIDTWKRLMKQAVDAGMRKATLTGGECLTYPYFDEVYLFLCNLGIGVTVLSNGVLMDQNRIDFFKKNPPGLIQISVYGSSDDTYEKVTGYRVFNQVYDNLLMMQKAGLNVRIAITPNRFMIHDMQQLIELVESMHIPYEINSKLIPPRENTGRTVEDITPEQYVELCSIRAKSHNCELEPVDMNELLDENHKGKECSGILCGAGRSSFAISYEGKMMPCTSLHEFGVSVITGEFNDAWKKVNKYADKYKRPCECEGCVYSSVCIHCVAMHKRAPKGHCDPQICERTKRLAAAGFFHYKNS